MANTYYAYNAKAFRPSHYSSNTRVINPTNQTIVSKSGIAPEGYYMAGTQTVSNKGGSQTYSVFKPLQINPEPEPEKDSSLDEPLVGMYDQGTGGSGDTGEVYLGTGFMGDNNYYSQPSDQLTFGSGSEDYYPNSIPAGNGNIFVPLPGASPTLIQALKINREDRPDVKFIYRRPDLFSVPITQEQVEANVESLKQAKAMGLKIDPVVERYYSKPMTLAHANFAKMTYQAESELRGIAPDGPNVGGDPGGGSGGGEQDPTYNDPEVGDTLTEIDERLQEMRTSYDDIIQGLRDQMDLEKEEAQAYFGKQFETYEERLNRLQQERDELANASSEEQKRFIEQLRRQQSASAKQLSEFKNMFQQQIGASQDQLTEQLAIGREQLTNQQAQYQEALKASEERFQNSLAAQQMRSDQQYKQLMGNYTQQRQQFEASMAQQREAQEKARQEQAMQFKRTLAEQRGRPQVEGVRFATRGTGGATQSQLQRQGVTGTFGRGGNRLMKISSLNI